LFPPQLVVFQQVVGDKKAVPQLVVGVLTVLHTHLITAARAHVPLPHFAQAHRQHLTELMMYLNITRRLERWMKQTKLPRTPLRKRYVRALHCICLMTEDCSRRHVLLGMQKLMDGFPDQHDMNVRLIHATEVLQVHALQLLLDRDQRATGQSSLVVVEP